MKRGGLRERVRSIFDVVSRLRERARERTRFQTGGGQGWREWRSYVPLFKVSRASWGSQVDQSSASWEKLTVSSCPSTGNTNSPLNVRDNRSVKFRKHWRRSSAFIPVVRVSASLQQVVTGSLVVSRFKRAPSPSSRFPLFGRRNDRLARTRVYEFWNDSLCTPFHSCVVPFYFVIIYAYLRKYV